MKLTTSWLILLISKSSYISSIGINLSLVHRTCIDDKRMLPRSISALCSSRSRSHIATTVPAAKTSRNFILFEIGTVYVHKHAHSTHDIYYCVVGDKTESVYSVLFLNTKIIAPDSTSFIPRTRSTNI